jgi:hypothetical protein
MNGATTRYWRRPSVKALFGEGAVAGQRLRALERAARHRGEACLELDLVAGALHLERRQQWIFGAGVDPPVHVGEVRDVDEVLDEARRARLPLGDAV